MTTSDLSIKDAGLEERAAPTAIGPRDVAAKPLWESYVKTRKPKGEPVGVMRVSGPFPDLVIDRPAADNRVS